jgi:hypothetical protein
VSSGRAPVAVDTNLLFIVTLHATRAPDVSCRPEARARILFSHVPSGRRNPSVPLPLLIASPPVGHKAYWSETHRRAWKSRGGRYRVRRRGHATAPLSDQWRDINRIRSRVRARGKHAFHVVKRIWGFGKVRYRGLAKNSARVFTAFALANLYLVRRRLLPRGAECVL